MFETAKEALKLGYMPHEMINDLKMYLKLVKMRTAKHNAEAGDKGLALKLLMRNDIKLAYKKILLSTIYSGTIESDFSKAL